MRIRLPNEWRPRPYQMRAWEYMERGGKRAVLVWHRRAGKDDFALHWAAVAAHQRPATYWHMLPQYAQGRKAIWEAVNPHTGKRRIDEAFPKELRRRTDSQTMTIELKNGSMWHVVGSDNYNALVGSPPAGITFSEWALADPAAWGYIRPILDENNGWALFIYTSRGRNHGFTMYDIASRREGWFAERLTAKETGAISPESLKEARQELIDLYGKDVGEMMYEQEYNCSFDTPVLGSFYGQYLREAEEDGRITRVPYERLSNVITAWDLGVGDSTAIWFAQVIGSEIRLIDYYESSGVGLDHYAKVLQEKGYVYGEHLFPHDVQVRELGTGRSRQETLESLGIRVTVVPKLSVEDGINAARMLLPRCWFDRDKCAKGIDALRQYKREWDEKRRAFRLSPLHDWTSHAADAFRYLAVGMKETDKTWNKPIEYDTRWVV